MIATEPSRVQVIGEEQAFFTGLTYPLSPQRHGIANDYPIEETRTALHTLGS